MEVAPRWEIGFRYVARIILWLEIESHLEKWLYVMESVISKLVNESIPLESCLFCIILKPLAAYKLYLQFFPLYILQ